MIRSCDQCGGYFPSADGRARFCSDECQETYWEVYADEQYNDIDFEEGE